MESTVSLYMKCSHLWTFLCYCGLMYSVVIFSDDYLERYEVTDSEDLDILSWPSVSFCLRNPSILKPETKLFHLVKNSCRNRLDSACIDKLTSMNSGEVFEGTFDLDDMFVDKVMYEKQPLTKFSAKSFINKFFKCSRYTFDEKINPIKGLIFELKMEAVSGPLLVYLTTRDSYPRGMQVPIFFLQDFQTGFYDWKYSHIPQIKLGAPYPDNCFDYTAANLENQDHCLENCIYEANGKLMPYVFTVIPGENVEFGNTTLLYNENCFETCSRVNCHEDIILVDRTRVTRSNVSTAIHLGTTEKPVLVLYEPDITFSKYVIYIGSLLNTWFGFYVFNLDLAIYRFIRKHNRIKFNWQLKLVVSLLISLGCFAGCLYQILCSAVSYFSYDAQSEVYIGPPLLSQLRIPVMSVCFGILDVLDKEKMEASSVCVKQAHNDTLKWRRQCQHELNGRLFSDIDSKTFNFERMVELLLFHFPTFNVAISGENMTSIGYATGSYFKDNEKCLKVDLSRIFIEYEPDYKQLMQLSGPLLMRLTLNKHTLPNSEIGVKIYLHPDDSLPYGLHRSVLETTLNEYEMLFYAYDTYRLLEAPFSSNCFDYKSDKSNELVSQQHCLETCLLKHSASRTSQVIITETMLKNSYLDDQKVSLPTMDTCKRKCSRPDCFEVDFRVRSKFKPLLSEGWAFMLSLPTMTFYTILTPDMKLLEFLLYVASVSALWFNFNLLTTLKAMGKKLDQIYATRRQYSRKVRRCLFLSLLWSGFALHAHLTLVMYFNRETVTDGAISDAKKIQSPAVTICFHYAVSVNSSILSLKCSAASAVNGCDEENQNYSPFELNRGSKALKDLLGKMEIRKIDGKNWEVLTGEQLVALDAITEISYFFTYKCFTINLNREYSLSKLEYNPESLQVLRISGGKKALTLLFLHPVGFPVRKNFVSKMTLLKPGKHKEVAYMPMTSILLPSPYEPTCTPYDDLAFNCQDACLDHCVQSMAKKHYNYSTFAIIRSPEDPYKPARDRFFQETARYCKDVCIHRECKSTSLSILQINSESDEELMATVVALRWKISVEYYARMKFLDLVIYIGGLFGLWFGIAYVSILKDFLKSKLVRRHFGKNTSNFARKKRMRTWISLK
ncbi:hypothetical protein HDE_14271 [Halotydeus destructor]|nr:hypothetical protein HDE_14271 [Halotydeus destructor]